MIGGSRHKWIEVGYELFAKEGAEGIMVERLGRILNLNKSAFYYYFKTPENFIVELLKHHREMAHNMAKEIAHCETLDPDYFKLVVRFKIFVLVQARLGWKSTNVVYNAALEDVREIIAKPLLPLWKRTFNLPDDLDLVRRHFSLFRNVFHAQANAENITYEFLHTMLIEARSVLSEVFNSEARSKNTHEVEFATGSIESKN